MTDPIRSALKRLLSAVLDGLGQDDHPMGWARVDDAIDAARAALADEADGPAVPESREPAAVTGQPSDGEVAELVETLKGIAYWRRHGKPGEPAPASFDIRQADRLNRAADLLQRLSPPQPVAVSERLPGPEDCLDEGWAWFFSPRVGWRQAVFPVSTAYTHWLPAHALPIPQQQKNAND